MSQAPPPAILSSEEHPLVGSRARHRREAGIRWVFLGAALTSILISVLIVASLIEEASAFLTSVDLSALWGDGWFPRRGLFDVKTIVVGSLLVTGIAMLVAAPLGLAAAIYLSEYARSGTRRFVKPVLEILAGIPSVVLGFFALTWISPNLVAPFCGGRSLFNLAAAGIGVGVLVTPLVASVSEDALRAVPASLREASYGLGARKLATTLRVVIPAAVSGLVAAMIIAVSRAIGETMVVVIAAGGSGNAPFTADVCSPGQTMTAAIASIASGTDQVKGATNAFQSLFFVGLLLFVITFVLNVAGERFVRRVRQRY
ncbi:MAG TPA: phosphate ABC transporter permease subunit PstC [Acidimicrobiia bacterium]|nr:phosphate ABC transporter permease subunit PstC [Acidimicrobiia bacterium]